MDVSQEGDWELLHEKIGRLDVLVACAGTSEAGAIAETSLEDWRRVMQVNVDGAFLSMKNAAKAMNEGGAIVLVGSASGIKAAPGAATYCASKAGVRMLVKTAALELKPRAIRVNCVSPAGVVTPMWKEDAVLARAGGEARERGRRWAVRIRRPRRFSAWRFRRKLRMRLCF